MALLNSDSRLGGGGQKTRIIGLDIARITLALLIYLFHSKVHLKCDYGFLNDFISNGHIVAMTAFFMLSGYSLYISNGHLEFAKSGDLLYFYKKRLISIYPLYLFVGLFGVLMFVISGSQSLFDNIVLIPIEILSMQSFFETLFPFAHNGGTWFISCLVFCYYLFPLLLVLVKMLKRNYTLTILASLILLLAYVPYITERFETASIYTNPFFRMLEFTVGMLLARINNEERFKGKFLFVIQNWIVLLLASFILIVGVSLCVMFNFYIFWIPICIFSVILIGVGSIRMPTCLNNKIIIYLSGVSYAFFLGQFFVWYPMKVFIHFVWKNPSNMALIFLSFTICVFSAFILHELIEKPSAKWLKRVMI